MTPAVGLVLACCLYAQKGPEKALPPEVVSPDVLHQDVTHVDPGHYRMQSENKRVRVLRLTLRAGETSLMHDAADGLFVCLRECHLRLSDPAGRVQDIQLQDGGTQWVWAGTRSEKNLGGKTVELLWLEMETALPANGF